MFRPIAIIAIVFLAINTAWAGSKKGPKANINDKQFVIEKERKNVLPETSRLFTKVTPAPVNNPLPPLKFDLQGIEPDMSPLQRKIKLLRAQRDFLTKLYGSYLRAGFCSNPKRPYLSIFFDNKRSTNYDYGCHIKPIPFSKVDLLAYGKYFGNAFIMAGDAQYQRNLYRKELTKSAKENKNKKGKKKAVTKKKDEKNKRTLHEASIGVNFENRGSDWVHYQCKMKSFYLKRYDNKKSDQESAFNLSVLLDKTWKDQYVLKLASEYAPSYGEYWQHLGQFKPAIVIPWKDINVELGGNLSLQGTTETKTHNKGVNLQIAPFAHFDYTLKDVLTPYLTVEGEIKKNSHRRLLKENPMLITTAKIQNTCQPIGLRVGMRSYLFKRNSFQISCSIKQFKKQYFFVNKDRFFDLLYDNPWVTHAMAEWSFTNARRSLTFHLRGSYFYYKMDQLSKPWHRPQYVFEGGFTYNLYDELFFNIDAVWLGGIYAKLPENDRLKTKETMKRLSDNIELNAGMDYLFSRRFAAFVKVKNPLSAHNERYLHYTPYPFKVFGGITLTL